jgi:amino acid adenylation domain-containing protein
MRSEGASPCRSRRSTACSKARPPGRRDQLLETAANRLARHLRALGVGPEARVAVLLERSIDLVVALLAVLKAGGAYVPIDPAYPAERIAFLLADSAATVLMTEGDMAGSLPTSPVRIVRIDADRDRIGARPAARLDGPDEPSSLAYIIYTSGSTGRPKGVQVTHANVARLFAATEQWFRFGPGDVWTFFHSVAFDFSVWEIWGALLHGGRLVVVPYEVSRSPEQFLDLLTRERVTVLNQTPSAFTQLVNVDEERGGISTDLRLVIFGGEALDPAGLASWFAHHGDERPLLVNMYGITETTVHVTYRPLREADARGERRSIIGVPIPDLSLVVMDQALGLVPIGVPGELVIGGSGLARGYLGRPELTAERFVPDPTGSGPGERLYRSGDLGRLLPDGEFEYLGRIDHQVKIRGFRIELGEIEAQLVALAEVREAVVVVREDTPGNRRLVAYVVGDIAADALRQSLRERLPDYMLPAAFVTLAALPLTPNGKVDRKALPAPERQGTEEGFLAPRTPVEEILAAIWAEVLGLEQVGAADHFFDLGGHSLLAILVTSRLRGAFDIEMPLRDLFEAPVLADLAARIEMARRAGAVPPAPSLVPVSRERPLPLSFAQQRLWFIDQFEPGSPLYNIPVGLRVEGPLHSELLALCLGEIVRRHETLRTVFTTLEGSPVQVIRPAEPFGMTVVDLSGLPESQREARALLLAREEAARPFDLARGPLLRVLQVRLAEGEHVIALTIHHIASDGWSMGILVRELQSLYEASLQGQPRRLPPLPIQYADFAVWQRGWLQGEVLETEIAYWHERLAGAPPLLDLPLDRPRPAVQSTRGAAVGFMLPPEVSRSLQVLARRQGATMFMVLLAGLQALLARYSGQERISVGTPSAGRTRSEIESLIGFFVNTLVVHTDVSGDPGLEELMARVRERALEAYLHQDLPFEKVVEELAPERSLSHSPLFQVMFDLAHVDAFWGPSPGLRVLPLETSLPLAKFDLSLTLTDFGSDLRGSLEYNTDLFDLPTIRRLLEHWAALLAAAVRDPQLGVFRLPLLADPERRQLLQEWNDITAYCLREECLHELFETQVERTPEAEAIAFESERLSYRALNEQANRLGHHLRGLGVGPETVVALCLERGVQAVIAMLAVLKAGGAYLPLAPSYPRERLAWMLQDACVPVLITEERLLGLLPESGARTICVDRDRDRIDLQPCGNPRFGASPANLAYVMYTSGSTGRPRGVLVPHRAIASFVRAAEMYEIRPGDRVLQFASISFDTSAEEIWTALASGATLVPRTEEMAASIPHFLGELARLGITALDLPTAFWHEMVAAMEAEALELPRGLRLVILGGEEALADRFAVWHRRVGSSVRLVNTYGPTETTVVATSRELSGLSPGGIVPIGRPIPGVRAYVLDRFFAPVPPGVRGELWIGGAGVARGYLGRPELTAERFVPHPFSDRSRETGARLYRTGDLALLRADGELIFAGRADRQVKIRGYRIEPGEIEEALLALPGIREAVVLAREDRPEAGPGDRKLVAYVVGDDSGMTADALRQSLRERLPDYMVPAAFVRLAALPLTPNGKVDRKALPAPERQASGESFLAPRTPVEELLAVIWSELLGLDRIGAADHFFELGGHSLLATRVMSRLWSTFGVELPLRALFEAPTLADFAARVEESRRTGAGRLAPPLILVPRRDFLPLSFAQQRLWFIDQLLPGNPAYSLPSALRIVGALDPQALAESFGVVVARHEVLRTTFAVHDGEPVQRIAPPAAVPVPIHDLTGLPPDRAEAEAHRLATQEARRPFDLARGPLLRVALVRLGDREHALLINLHHIVGDAWSAAVLIRELTALYASFVQGTTAILPELPVQYADYAVWQREWLQGEALEAQLAWWRRELAGSSTSLDLPFDRPRPAVSSQRGGSVALALSAELAVEIEALSRRSGATLFMTLLAGWSGLLSRYAAHEDVLVGSPIANRTRLETENLIGFFVNTLVLRTDLSGEPDFGGLVARVRHATLGAYDHQDLPFERLVEELAPERSLNRSPLFQVMFSLQNAPAEAIEMSGLELRPLRFANETAKFDLSLSLIGAAGRLHASLGYNAHLFDRATAERLLGHFCSLLAGAVADPASRLADLPLLSAIEREQLAREAEASRRAAPDVALTVPRLFAEVAERMPTARAIHGAGEDITFGELRRWSSRLAGLLRGEGVGQEQRVVVCAEPSAALVAGVLGVLEAGGVWVPLDPAHPDDRLAGILRDSAASLLLVESRLADRFAGLGTRTLLIEAARIAEGDLENHKEETAPVPLEAAAYVIYTSGTTGRPKGTVVSHRSLSGYLAWFNGHFGTAGTLPIPSISSPGFDASLKQFLAPLLRGEAVWIVPPGTASRPDDLLGEIAAHGRAALNCVPSLWRVLLERIEAGYRVDGALRRLLLGGEAVDLTLVERTLAALPGIEIWNLYGPTEATANASCARIVSGKSDIGRGVAGAALHIVDRHLQLVPPGIPGELAIVGNGLARGYLGLPAVTAERFLPNPFAIGRGERLYLTGDRARVLPGGGIELLGRLDRQVKIRGFRLEPGEIEAALCRHPSVARAVVAARGSTGEDRRLVAWVVPAGDTMPQPAELRTYLRSVLPEPMVPSAWTVLPSLPLTPNGKVDLAALPPPGDSAAAANAYEEPRTVAERQIAEIWRDLLDIERVGLNDNFFDLGGHSLLMMRVQSRLRDQLGREVTMVDLFSHTTVGSLARLLTDAEGAGSPSPVRSASQEQRMASGKDRLRRLRQARL